MESVEFKCQMFSIKLIEICKSFILVLQLGQKHFHFNIASFQNPFWVPIGSEIQSEGDLFRQGKANWWA